MKRSIKFLSLVLVFTIIASLLFVSCPNNTIGGSVEKDGRSNAEILITGTIGKPLTDSRKFTVTLNNATFRNFSRGEDVSAWFVDKEGNPSTIDGLKYRIANPVASGSNKASIRITGTPTVASKEQIHLLIPCDTFQGSVKIDVDTEGAIRYNIIDYIEPTLTLIKEDGNNMTIDGMEQKEIDTKTIKFQLNNAHFTSADALNGNIDNSASGDGTIINTRGGGQQFDENTAKWLNFKWEIGTGKNENGELNELDLIVTGTADKVRGLDSGDTFKVKLIKGLLYDGSTADKDGNPIISIIDDNNGEPYVKDIPIDGTGVYNFVELAPTLVLQKMVGQVSNELNSYEAIDTVKMSGTTDTDESSGGFAKQTAYFLLYDVNVSNYTYISNYGDSSDSMTIVNGNEIFGSSWDDSNLRFYITISTTNSWYSEEDRQTNVSLVRVEVGRKYSGYGDDTTINVYEGIHNLILPKGLVSKAGASDKYDKPITSKGTIEFKIKNPEPFLEGEVFFTGNVGKPTSSAAGNGGLLTIKNKDVFRFKESSGVNKIDLADDNSPIKVSPIKPFFDYYYQIVTYTDGTPSKLYLSVKPNSENPNAMPTYEDAAYTSDGVLISSKADATKINVSFASSLFEEKKGDEWQGFAGERVESDKLLSYKILNKASINTNPSTTNNSYQVEEKGSNGDTYRIEYINTGTYSYGDVCKNFGDGTSTNVVWPLIPGAIPTSSVGKLVSIPIATAGVLERVNGKFNTSVNYNMLNKYNANGGSGLDVLYGMYDSAIASSSRNPRKEIPNSGFSRFQVLAELPSGYKLSEEITENDVKIFAAKKTDKEDSWASTNNKNYPEWKYSEELIDLLNNNLKLKLEVRKDAKFADSTAKDADNNSTLLFVYVDSLTDGDMNSANEDERNKLTKAILKEQKVTDFGGSEVALPELFLPEIRLNPSKVLEVNDDGTATPYETEAMALAPRTEGVEYDGTVSKLKNGDLWIPLASDIKLKIVIYPVDAEGNTTIYKDNSGKEKTFKPLTWQYRIMDRADYANITPMNLGGTGTYCHTPQSLSMNADLTTGLKKWLITPTNNSSTTRDGQVIKPINGYLTFKYLNGGDTIFTPVEMPKITRVGEKNAFTLSNYDHKSNEYFLATNGMQSPKYDGIGTPIREIVNEAQTSSYGHIIEMTEYNKENRPTISASDLREIVDNAKRKGYRVWGFARGLNKMFSTSYDKSTSALSAYSRSIYSDLLPYKAVDDFGNSVDWEIYYNEDGSIDNGKTTVLTKGITLELSDTRAYRPYIDVPANKESSSNEIGSVFSNSVQAYADWFNTTYIYLVWQKDPNSIYYNVGKTTENAVDEIKFSEAYAGVEMNFVRIPGDLKWLGFHLPYSVDNGSCRSYSLNTFGNQYVNQLKTNNIIGDFTYFDDVSTYDYAIADIEMTGKLFDTVYDWAIKNGYEFENNSTAHYYSVKKNPYDTTVHINTDTHSTSYGTVLSPEVSSFGKDFVYGGKRPHTSNSRSSTYYEAKGTGVTYNYGDTTHTGSTYREIYSVNYTNVDSNERLNHPVTNFNLYDAMLFCNALTEWYNETYKKSLDIPYTRGKTHKKYSDIYSEYFWSDMGFSDSVGKTGFRLPTYNEWFAAASIVPEANNFLANAALDDSSWNNYADRRGAVYVPGVESGTDRTWSSNTGDQLFDTSYPFMQSLMTVSGINESNAYGEDVGSGHIAEFATYAHTNKDFKSTMLESTQPVNTGKPNALGLYAMSGNVAEWTVDYISGGGGPVYAIAGGDFAGSEPGATLYGGAKLSGDIATATPRYLPGSFGSVSSYILNSGNTSHDEKKETFTSWTYSNDGDRFFAHMNYLLNGVSESRDPIVSHEALDKYSSGNAMSYGTLNTKQRSRNVGFRVCRTIKSDT